MKLKKESEWSPTRVLVITLSFWAFLPLGLGGNTRLGMPVARAESLGFKLESARDTKSAGVLLIATPPTGFKVNVKYPNSIRTLGDRKVHRPIVTKANQMVFEFLTGESKDLAISLAYCNLSICKIDQRKLHWDKITNTLSPPKD